MKNEKRAEELSIELIKAYEIATTTRFKIFKQTGGFSSNGKHFVQVPLSLFYFPRVYAPINSKLQHPSPTGQTPGI